MLHEITETRQIHDERPRRWFSDASMDLIVWFNPDNDIASFQLCYDKPFAEHALTWRKESGFLHNRVDDGEAKPGSPKGTPILVPDGEFNLNAIADKFMELAREIDTTITDFVVQKLRG